MKLIILISLLAFLVPKALPQSRGDEKARWPGQLYIEDSVHVFWVQYPNPFSGPTVTDSTQGCFQGDHSFYCDLAETVEVLLVNEKDSVVSVASTASPHPPRFSVSICVAGKKVRHDSVPERAFRAPRDSRLSVVLSVRGHRKVIHPWPITVLKGHYCWVTGE
jgi:hypothetical protein